MAVLRLERLGRFPRDRRGEGTSVCGGLRPAAVRRVECAGGRGRIMVGGSRVFLEWRGKG